MTIHGAVLTKLNATMLSEDDRKVAIDELETITLDDVMAQSQLNLDNTHTAIVHLSAGRLGELRSLVVAAKRDFRDVIYWASQRS